MKASITITNGNDKEFTTKGEFVDFLDMQKKAWIFAEGLRRLGKLINFEIMYAFIDNNKHDGCVQSKIRHKHRKCDVNELRKQLGVKNDKNTHR